MKYLPPVLCFLVTLLAPSTRAAIIWDESVNGDLPASLGTLQLGVNTIKGAVGVGGGYGSGDFIDSDDVQFQLPSGTLISQFLVKAVSGGDYTAFGLDKGSKVAANTVGFGLFYPSDPQTDLLRFGSGKGPQPAGNYIFGVTNGSDTGFRTYQLDIVISAVPEPSTWTLTGEAVVGMGLAMLRRRRSTRLGLCAGGAHGSFQID